MYPCSERKCSSRIECLSPPGRSTRAGGYRRGSPPAGVPGAEGRYLSLDNWRTREWYDALDAAGIERRGPYHLRHTFASEALAAGISIFELSRVMGASVREIDRTYGHLVRDAEDTIRARLNARADQTGVSGVRRWRRTDG